MPSHDSRHGYDSFGKQTTSSGSLTNPFQYTGREHDRETSLYYYRSRYIDASTGRFLSEDPIAFLAGTNFYTYVENDPVGWADPTGQEKCKKSCGVKKGPEYGPSGTIPGGTSFAFGAEFLNDSDHSPSCCEVRQFILWNQALKTFRRCRIKDSPRTLNRITGTKIEISGTKDSRGRAG